VDCAFRSGILALAFLLAGAESVRAADLQPQATLPATEQRFGVAAHIEEDRVHFWSCEPDCKAGQPSLSVEIPAHIGKGPRRVEALRTKKGSALWIQLGPQENFYSLVAVGSLRGEKSGAPPSLILKGWAGEKSESKTTFQHSRKNGEESLSVSVAASPAACGRSVPLITRMLDFEQGRFLTVRAAVLSAKEKESATRLVARPEGVAEKLLLALSANGDRSAVDLVDGDRETPWSEGYEFIELKGPASGSLGEIILQVAEPLQEERSLSLVTTTRVYQVVLPVSAEKTYVVSIPEEKDLCVALIQPRSPVPVSEVMVAMPSPQLSTAELVGLLENSDPGHAVPALLLRGLDAGLTLADRFHSMSPMAKSRALELATKLSGDAGIPVFVAAIESGSAEQAEAALDALDSKGAPGLDALEERLKGAVAQTEGKLIFSLMRISPVRAAQILPPLLEGSTSTRRTLIRSALSKLSSDPDARAVLKQLLRDLLAAPPSDNSSPSPSKALSRPAQVELVRALSPLLNEEKGMEAFLIRLAREADFEDAYHLAPHVAPAALGNKNLEEILGRWLLGRTSVKLALVESSALSVHVLGILRDLESNALTERYDQQLGQLLDSENMRVREAALVNLATSDSQVGRQRAKQFLVRDEWPQIRAAAAGVVAGSKTERDEVERILGRRMKRDRDDEVRRAIAQALVRTGGESAVGSLRRALSKDESYSVRAEAALSLGKLCDTQSVDALTQAARRLASGTLEDGPIELGLAAVTALAYLAPPDIEQRLAPLLSDKTPSLTRKQVEKRLEMARISQPSPICRR
jgi:hypothetical protein